MAHKKLTSFSGAMDAFKERRDASRSRPAASRVATVAPPKANGNVFPTQGVSVTAFPKTISPLMTATVTSHLSPRVPSDTEPPLRLPSPAFPKTTTPLETPAQALRRVSVGTATRGRDDAGNSSPSFQAWNTAPLRKQSKVGSGEKREGGKMAGGEGVGSKVAHKTVATPKTPLQAPEIFAPKQATARVKIPWSRATVVKEHHGDDLDGLDDPNLDLNLIDPFYLSKAHDRSQKARASFAMSGNKDDKAAKRVQPRHTLNRKMPTPEAKLDAAVAATGKAKGCDASATLSNKLGEDKMTANGKVQTWLQKLEEPTVNRINPTLVTPDLRKRKHFVVFGLAPSNDDAQDAPRAFKRTRVRETSGGTAGRDDALPGISPERLADERRAADRASEVLGGVVQDDESEAESFRSAFSTKPAPQGESGSQLAPAVKNNALSTRSEAALKPDPGRKKGVAYKVPKKKVKFDGSADTVKDFYDQMPVSGEVAAWAKKEEREEEGMKDWRRRVQTWERL